jgi:predicted nucleic acid-binding protein
MLVLDASACVSYLLGDDHADWVRERVQGEVLLHAPSLIDYEVGSALRLLSDRRRALQAFDDFAAIRLLRHPGQPFLLRVWELRHRLSAYDAAYVALAEALDLPLLTLDQRLTRAGGHAAMVQAP